MAREAVRAMALHDLVEDNAFWARPDVAGAAPQHVLPLLERRRAFAEFSQALGIALSVWNPGRLTEATARRDAQLALQHRIRAWIRAFGPETIRGLLEKNTPAESRTCVLDAAKSFGLGRLTWQN